MTHIYALPDDDDDPQPAAPTGLPPGQQLAVHATNHEAITLAELEAFLTTATTLGLTPDTPIRARPAGWRWAVLSWLHIRPPHPTRIETARRTHL